MHWWTVLTWQLILGGVIMSIATSVLAINNPEPYVTVVQDVSMTNILGLLWVIILNTALGYGMYVWLLQRMSVVDFTFGGIANPVAGIVSGLLLLGGNVHSSAIQLNARNDRNVITTSAHYVNQNEKSRANLGNWHL